MRAIWRDLFHPTLRFTDRDSVNGHLVPFRTGRQMGLTEYTATVAGKSRRWQVYRPTRYRRLAAHGRTLPLVIAFHGRNRIAGQYPHLFAAIAPCYSGHLNAASYGDPIVRTDVPLPVWQCRGVNEVPTDYPGGAAEYRWTINDDIGHCWPEHLAFKLWDDFLSKYRRCPTAPWLGSSEADRCAPLDGAAAGIGGWWLPPRPVGCRRGPKAVAAPRGKHCASAMTGRPVQGRAAGRPGRSGR